MAEGDVSFDLTEGRWRVIATNFFPDSGNTWIQFYKDDAEFRGFAYPSYKIWNIHAHFSDIIQDFESEEAETAS